MTQRERLERLPLIDSLRALAALLIFAYHALFVTGNLTSRNYGDYLNVGVPLFYGISGLLLFKPYVAAIISSEGELPSWRAYARHRVFRIVPAYWLALPIVAVLLGRAAQVFTPEGVVTYFGFLQMYRLSTFVGGIGQAWTLCVEVTFYLFLPFWAALLSFTCGRWGSSIAARVRILLAAVAILALASLAWKVAVVGHFGPDQTSALIPLTILPAALDQFAAGMLIAVLVVAREMSEGPNRLLAACGKYPVVAVLVALAAYFLIGTAYGNSPLDYRFEPSEWGKALIVEHELKTVFVVAMLLASA